MIHTTDIDTTQTHDIKITVVHYIWEKSTNTEKVNI